MTAKRSPKNSLSIPFVTGVHMPKKPNHPGDPEAAAIEMACIVEVGGIPYIERKKKRNQKRRRTSLVARP